MGYAIMNRWFAMILLGGLCLAWLSADAQQPKDKDKPPPFPPINPAVAKLDITISGLDGPGFAIAYGNGSNLLVAACEKGTLQVFKKDTIDAFKSGKGKAEAWKGHDGPVRAVAWHGGPTLVSAGKDKKVNFWKVPEGKVASSGNADFRVRAMAMSNDGKSLAVAGESDTIQLWDVAAGKPTIKLADKMDWTLALAFSADGKQLLSGDYRGDVWLWDVSGKKIAMHSVKQAEKKPPPDPSAVTALAFAPDGKTAILGNDEGAVYLFNLGDGKIVRTFTGHTGPITGIAFHPSGTVMATVSKDRTVKLWNPAGPQPAVQALKSLDGHGAWIEGIVFIDEATKLATVSADQTVRIWDLTEPKKK